MALYRSGGKGSPKITRYINVIGSGSVYQNAATNTYNATPQHGGTIIGTYINTNGVVISAGGSEVTCNQTNCSIHAIARYDLTVSWTAYSIEIVVK